MWIDMRQRPSRERTYGNCVSSTSAGIDRAFEVIIDGYSYLESPRWRDRRLWFSDFYSHRVVSTNETGGDTRVEAQVPQQPSGLGWLPDGRLLVVSMRDRTILRRELDGELVVHADLAHLVARPLNDLVVDDRGRAYVGNFGFDLMAGDKMATAPLVCVDIDGSASVVSEPLHFPNGAVIADGRLIVGETFGNRISAFDVHDDGSLSDRRDWARFGPLPDTDELASALQVLAVGPDGMCLDSRGALWVADALGQRAIRVLQGGQITDTIHLDTGVFALALGGHDGRTLFICTAPSFAEHERRSTRESRIVTTRVDVSA